MENLHCFDFSGKDDAARYLDGCSMMGKGVVLCFSGSRAACWRLSDDDDAECVTFEVGFSITTCCDVSVGKLEGFVCAGSTKLRICSLQGGSSELIAVPTAVLDVCFLKAKQVICVMESDSTISCFPLTSSLEVLPSKMWRLAVPFACNGALRTIDDQCLAAVDQHNIAFLDPFSKKQTVHVASRATSPVGRGTRSSRRSRSAATGDRVRWFNNTTKEWETVVIGEKRKSDGRNRLWGAEIGESMWVQLSKEKVEPINVEVAVDDMEIAEKPGSTVAASFVDGSTVYLLSIDPSTRRTCKTPIVTPPVLSRSLVGSRFFLPSRQFDDWTIIFQPTGWWGVHGTDVRVFMQFDEPSKLWRKCCAPSFGSTVLHFVPGHSFAFLSRLPGK